MSHLLDLENAFREKNQGHVITLIKKMFPNDPNLNWASAIIGFIFGQAPFVPTFVTDTRSSLESQQREILACRHINQLLRQKRRSSGNHVAQKRKTVDYDYDCLGDRFTPESWGIAMTINYILMTTMLPSKRAAVVVTMRDDGLSLLEWIAHYRVLNFDHIFVYTNNNDDLSEFLLREIADIGFITLIEQETSLGTNPQIRAFEHSIHFLEELRDFEWVIYLDSDEFLELDPEYHHSIQDFLSNVEARSAAVPPSGVFFKWRWHISGYRYDWQPEILLTRFKHAGPHPLYKSIVRLSDVVSMRQVHFPETKTSSFFMDANMNYIESDNVWPHKGGDNGGRLNHYWCKSFQEFVNKKRRGDTITGVSKDVYGRDLSLFFQWNGTEKADNLVIIPNDLINAVEIELRNIRNRPLILELEQRCQKKFFEIISSFSVDKDLKELYDLLRVKYAKN